jgi:thermitase
MKTRLIVKLHQPITSRYIPYWQDFINDKSATIASFDNEIDLILHKYNLDFWATKEFKPGQGGQFDNDEINCGLNRIYRIILQQNRDLPPGLVDEIKLIPIVEDARPAVVGQADLPARAEALSTDGLFDWPRKHIYLPEDHLFTKGRPEIKVAILDTGADLDHPEIRDAVEKRADFVNVEGLDTTTFVGDFLGYDYSPDDEVGRGTHVAGIIAGRGLKMPGGVAPLVRLMIMRVPATPRQWDKTVGAGLIDNINTEIKWAVDNGADVINMSLGVRHEYGGLPHEEVVRYALSKGVTIVAAAGNDGTNDKYYPGALPGVIAVGAVDEKDHIAPLFHLR